MTLITLRSERVKKEAGSSKRRKYSNKIETRMGCKTRETLQNFGIFLVMNFTLELKICRLQNLPLPPESMLITLSVTMVISCLANIVQGGGEMFYLGLGYSKIRQKTVKCLISFATDCM